MDDLFDIFCKLIWIKNLKQDEAQSARLESTHKGVNQSSKYVTQVQQQRPESPGVTLAWHACKNKVHKLRQRYILCLTPLFVDSFRLGMSVSGECGLLPNDFGSLVNVDSLPITSLAAACWL